MFSLTYKYKETAYTIFSSPSNPPLIPTPLSLIIITVSNPPPYYSNPFYYSGLESRCKLNNWVMKAVIDKGQFPSNKW